MPVRRPPRARAGARAPSPLPRPPGAHGPPPPAPRPMEPIDVRAPRRSELIEITHRLQHLVERSGVREGVLVAQTLHTTSALTINENADPDVRHDLIAKLEELIPHKE